MEEKRLHQYGHIKKDGREEDYNGNNGIGTRGRQRREWPASI